MSMKLKDIPFETLMPTIVPTDKVPATGEALVSGEGLVAIVGARSIQMLDSWGGYFPVVSAGYQGDCNIWFFNGVAGMADFACCAGYADSAGYVDQAGCACYAGWADCACYAGLADYANCAGCACYAGLADCACYACHAGATDYALWADCADYACCAGQALWAGCAGSADGAIWAGYALRIGLDTLGDEAAAIAAEYDGLYFEFKEQGDDGSMQVARKRLSHGEACSLPAGAKVLYFI